MNWITAAESVAGVIMRAVEPADVAAHIINERDMLSLHEVARWLFAGARTTGQTIRPGDRLPTMTLKQLETAAIKQALEDAGGHRGRACAALGINESTLYRITNGITQSKWGRPKGQPIE